MIEAFAQGAIKLFEPEVFGFLLLGTVLGLVIGVIPAIGPMMGMALALPFLFGVKAEVAIPFIIAIEAVSYTSGGTPSILIGIPGTGPNAATIIDGYPMAQRGEASRALGAGITSSVFGGIIAVPMALLMVPLVIPMVMAFKSPEMLALIFMGLCFLAVLARGSMTKGLISGFAGLLIACVGFQELTGLPRFTFGLVPLYDGINLVALVLGLFALAELIDLYSGGQRTIAQVRPAELGGWHDILEGARDVLRHFWLWLRCSVIGFIIGVIPGIGAETAVFVAYGHAKQSSKHPEKYGTGCIEGVIAPESADNAKEAGSVLTTLAFGIPGSAAMVFVLAVFIMGGIQPGQAMLSEHLDLTFTILLSIVVANLIGGLIYTPLIRHVAKITFVDTRYLIPIIMVLVFVGAYTIRGSLFNLGVASFFGIIGYFMKRFGYSRPALLLGFVLGSLFEQYLFHSIAMHGTLFFLTPISLVLIIISLGVLSSGTIRRFFGRWFQARIKP